jgi:signal transduction histidine kinase
MTAIRAAGGGLDLPRHLRAAGRTLLYLLLGLPNGLVYLVVVGGGLLVGAVLSIAWIGLPLMAAVSRLVWRLAEGERRQANRLLEAHLPPVPRVPRGEWREVLEATGYAPFWRALAMLLLKLPVALVGLALVAAPAVLAVILLVLAADGFGGVDDRYVGPWALGPALALALIVLAAAAAVVAIAAQEGAGRLLRALAQALLRSETTGEGPVREMLAERLGDRSLNIAYWLPDREIFVDERGHPVDLPASGTGRTWTAVEREGNRVAAIVHDAELDATPELVHAAASAAALALDNERLKADLRARLEELRHSRRRIVEAADDARRQIERDLHDGAQQQLVSLALDLRLLRARLKHEPEVAATVEELADKLAAALAELRELARGIHPAVLSDHGLGPAIHVLVERAPIAVECDLAIEDRLPAPIEAAAYFVVAEGLTNVIKYANATKARVSVRRRARIVEVVVSDDGIGGARIEAGSGLRGLSDRLAALEGELLLDSPLGEGTRLIARIPMTGGA